ncbi:unnamed protein product [Oikopleura dioica]|uniref:RING-type domain-containing protein n=1 Tax=Oikopleura dioica TaxID=34765 RepID=E4Z4N2_OIKDI|nr:unnamed protein product [Oikopleura dioica]
MKLFERIHSVENAARIQEVASMNPEIAQLWCTNCEQLVHYTLFKFNVPCSMQYIYGCHDLYCIGSEFVVLTKTELDAFKKFCATKTPTNEEFFVFRNFHSKLYWGDYGSFGQLWLHSSHQQASKRERAAEENCPICLETLNPTSTTDFPCSHSFCAGCYDQMTSNGMKTCPVCRLPKTFTNQYDFMLQ